MAKVSNNRTHWLSCIFLFFIVISIFTSYATGIRFTSLQAANADQFVSKESTLLDDVEIGSFKIFLYENDDRYRTVIVEQLYRFWKLNGNSFYTNKTNDSLKLVGLCRLQTKDKGVTVVPVQSFDTKVAYIKMGTVNDEIMKNISYGQVTFFVWDKYLPWNDFNAVAYSNEDTPLYILFGYDIVNNSANVSELRWYPFDEIRRVPVEGTENKC